MTKKDANKEQKYCKKLHFEKSPVPSISVTLIPTLFYYYSSPYLKKNPHDTMVEKEQWLRKGS